jgi:hypothetical protein
MKRTSESGLLAEPVHDGSKLTDFRPAEKLAQPGEYPFAREACPPLGAGRLIQAAAMVPLLETIRAGEGRHAVRAARGEYQPGKA